MVLFHTLIAEAILLLTACLQVNLHGFVPYVFILEHRVKRQQLLGEALLMVMMVVHKGKWKLRSQAPGQKSTCDLSGLTILVITKALLGRPHWGKLPSPHQIWCTDSALQSRTQTLQPNMFLCIPSQGTSIQRLLYWGPLVNAFLSPLLRISYHGDLKTFVSTLIQYLVLFHA